MNRYIGTSILFSFIIYPDFVYIHTLVVTIPIYKLKLNNRIYNVLVVVGFSYWHKRIAYRQTIYIWPFQLWNLLFDILMILFTTYLISASKSSKMFRGIPGGSIAWIHSSRTSVYQYILIYKIAIFKRHLGISFDHFKSTKVQIAAAEHFALWKLERIDLKILTFERWFPTPSSWLKPPTLYTIMYNSHSNLDIVNKSSDPFCSLYQIIH